MQDYMHWEVCFFLNHLTIFCRVSGLSKRRKGRRGEGNVARFLKLKKGFF